MASPGTEVVNKVRTDFETSGLAKAAKRLKGVSAEMRRIALQERALAKANAAAASKDRARANFKRGLIKMEDARLRKAAQAEKARVNRLRDRARSIGRHKATLARQEAARLAETARLHGVMTGHRSRAIKQMRTMGRIARAGLIGGVGIVGGLIAVGKAAQDSELRIAGLLQKNSQLFGGEFKGFKQAHSAAKGLRAEFREMARTSPVGSRAIESSFVSMTTELSRGGIALKQQKELAKQAAVADLGNATKGTAARDVSQLLRGRAGKDITTPALVGQTAKDIAALAKSGKIKEAAAAISKVLKPSKELEDAYARSFTGATSSLKDSLLEAAETAASPLMAVLADGAKDLLKWMTANKRQVKEIARSIGKGIVKGLKAAGAVVKAIADNWGLVSTALKISATVYLVRMAQTMIGLVASSAAYARNMALGSAAGAGAKGAGGLPGKLGKAGGALAIGVGIYHTAQFVAEQAANEQRSRISGAVNKKGSIVDILGRARAANARAATEASNNAIQIRGGWRAILGASGFGPQKGAATPGLEGGQFAGQATPQKDPRDAKKGGGGGGSRKVRRMMVDNMELSERGTTRLMSPVIREITKGIRRNSPLSTQVGLGGLRVANGVR